MSREPPKSRNAITDVAGLSVGQASDARIASGVTAVLFDEPAVASVSIGGGAPGVRDAALLETRYERRAYRRFGSGGRLGFRPRCGGRRAERAAGDRTRLSGARGRGADRPRGRSCSTLLNGGDKSWGDEPVYWHLGRAAAQAASLDVALGSLGAGLGATTATFKGGLGTASCITPDGFTVGAIVAVNALGSATIGGSRCFWAAPCEHDREFGGLGWPAPWPQDALRVPIKGAEPATTIAVVATDAILTKGEAKRLAIMAQDGLARALRPTHAAFDGDTVFAAATGRAGRAPAVAGLVTLGTLAADCLARAIARGIYEATALPFPRSAALVARSVRMTTTGTGHVGAPPRSDPQPDGARAVC